MANEIQVTAQLSYTNVAKNISVKSLQVQALGVNITGSNYHAGTSTVGTSAAAIPLGGLANVGWCIFKNNDATNYVQLMTGTAGVVFAQLMPGEIAEFRFDPTITAPAWKAHTASCEVEFLMLES